MPEYADKTVAHQELGEPEEQDWRLRDPETSVVACWVLADHTFGDHGLPNTGTAIHHETRHTALLRHFHKRCQSVKNYRRTVKSDPAITANMFNSFFGSHQNHQSGKWEDRGCRYL